MSKYLKWAAAIVTVSFLACASLADATTRPIETAKIRPVEKNGDDWVTRTIHSAYAKFVNHQYTDAITELSAIRDSEVFGNLPEDRKSSVYELIGLNEEMLGDYEAAGKDLNLAASVSPSLMARDRGAYYWRMVFYNSRHLKKPDVAIDVMTLTATEFPEEVNYWTSSIIAETLRNAIPLSDGAERRLKLLEALRKAGFHAEPFHSEQPLWFELMGLYVDKGDMAGAKTAALLIDEPRLIIRMRVDKRYRPFIDADPARYDLPKAIALTVTKARKAANDQPRSIEGATALARALKEANRATEGLAVIDAALKQAEDAPKDKPAFDDLSLRLDLAYDMRTRLLLYIPGSEKNIISAQIKSLETAKANKMDLLSPSVILGILYYQRDRPKDALGAIADISTDKASAYGKMAVESVRACAYNALGNQAEVPSALTYLRAHAKDSYVSLIRALYCVGDVDGLAALTLEQLNDPMTRNEVLVHQQRYLEILDAPQSDYTRRAKAIAQALTARKDIHEAVSRYGYIDSYAMYEPPY